MTDRVDHVDDHDRGLRFDIATLMTRRRALGLLAGAGVVALVGCGSNGDDEGSAAGGTTGPTTGSSSATSDSSGVSEIPDETAGPFPGDGSNGPNVLTDSGVVRADIRSSFGDASGTAEGVPLTLQFKVVDTANGGAPLAGAAVYVWHCDRDGNYSMYSQAAANENYLRGVQEAADDGIVTFTSIYPGAYPGRWPHVHIEVYPSLAAATSAGTPAKTTQLAFPEDACKDAYTADGYDQSVTNLAQTSLESDMVFADGWDLELATVTGSAAKGFTSNLTVGV
jgi:protocatechuate 3,4-dioxygenase beta subunit